MKVIVDIESTDMNGEVIKTNTNAMLEERQHDYKITYVEKLSDNDAKTKTTMHINEGTVRIIRDGEVASDFMYAEGLVHNSLYKTAYGSFPVTVTTKSFSFFGNRMTHSDDFFSHFTGVSSNAYGISMCVDIEYELAVEGAEPMDMKVSIKISN